MTSSHPPIMPGFTNGHVVIVGASLAGLRAAEALRAEGFTGPLTLIGDESEEPYDRPPLSKSVLTGWISAEHTTLPRQRNIAAKWLLGVPAMALDVPNREVQLADRRRIGFDRLLITTGTRARPWPEPKQAALDGVFTVRTREDAARLHARLASKPKRVLVIGAGFTGSEVASVCRELGLEVTVTERSATPLAGALGQAAGAYAAHLQRQHGVDLRCNTTVMALEGDAQKKLCRARLSDGDELDVEVAVVALGAVRNTEWLRNAGLAADGRGVVCDASCRVFDADGIVTDDIFVAGDVARWPHPLYDGELLVVEHWSNAVTQAETAAHNMLASSATRRAHKHLPSFWSNQFEVNIKAIGLPVIADTIVLTQGSLEEGRLVAAYGHQGRIIAAVAVNAARYLPAYQTLIEARAPFPPELHASDEPAELHSMPAGFPKRGQPTHDPGAVPTGAGPNTPEQPVEGDALTLLDPRVPLGAPPLLTPHLNRISI
ncbi:NAD(P)/FAD-dependent oxidoreductase [Ktedonospora formicarum]|uniref:Pyridine nucleotide-disulfide oxidoreductase n=1 Tax=Ktedonospora formicarum TaxID=2778364 RepID=A0A8J3MUX5_9CHLR|nr:FAD-dependent oxidoreductase [Ktedonospora formicarum]GHO45875.1 pyridine nucleotide-disulfide oxidoreductase [Ktedonospora formicarum]